MERLQNDRILITILWSSFLVKQQGSLQQLQHKISLKEEKESDQEELEQEHEEQEHEEQEEGAEQEEIKKKKKLNFKRLNHISCHRWVMLSCRSKTL